MRQWQEATCRLVNEAWETFAPCELVLSEAGISTNHANALNYDEPVIAIDNHINGVMQSSMFVIKRSLAIAIFRVLLGNEVSSLDDDRELTQIETGLLEVFFESLVAGCNDAQIEKPTCQLGTFDPKPDFVSKFNSDCDVAVVKFLITGPFGEHPIEWLWREDVISESLQAKGTTDSASNSEELLEVARAMPFEVTVLLGSATLQLSDLKALKEGDVIVFDQRVSDEMSAYISNAPFFHGWPGKVGKRQAFQITRTADS